MTMSADVDLSVIIPVRNAADDLRRCLTSVFENQGPRFEVIVVDDGSTDGTAHVALEYPCSVLKVSPSIRAANCRNLGARHARGDVLLFFDADQTMDATTIGRFVDALRDEPNVAAVVASFGPHTPARGFFSKFKNLRHHWVHQQARSDGNTLASGFTAIRRAVFDRFNGFEPAYGPSSIEDVSLGYKLHRAGYRIRFRPDIQVTHLKAYTLRMLLVSDVRDRAIPWTRLALRDRVWRNDLNTKSGNVLSVALAWLFPVLPLLGVMGAGVAGVALVATIGGANRSLLRCAREHLGTWFALQSAAFLPVMYFAHGAGLVVGLGLHLARWSVAPNVAPVPRFVIAEGHARSLLRP